MQCPVCGERMREVEKFGVEIDICPSCKGVWLDRGELEKIVGLDNQGFPQRSEYEREFEQPKPQSTQGQLRSEYQGDRYYDQHQRDDRERHRDDKYDKYDKHHRPHKRKSLIGELFGEIFD